MELSHWLLFESADVARRLKNVTALAISEQPTAFNHVKPSQPGGRATIVTRTHELTVLPCPARSDTLLVCAVRPKATRLFLNHEKARFTLVGETGFEALGRVQGLEQKSSVHYLFGLPAPAAAAPPASSLAAALRDGLLAEYNPIIDDALSSLDELRVFRDAVRADGWTAARRTTLAALSARVAATNGKLRDMLTADEFPELDRRVKKLCSVLLPDSRGSRLEPTSELSPELYAFIKETPFESTVTLAERAARWFSSRTIPGPVRDHFQHGVGSPLELVAALGTGDTGVEAELTRVSSACDTLTREQSELLAALLDKVPRGQLVEEFFSCIDTLKKHSSIPGFATLLAKSASGRTIERPSIEIERLGALQVRLRSVQPLCHNKLFEELQRLEPTELDGFLESILSLAKVDPLALIGFSNLAALKLILSIDKQPAAPTAIDPPKNVPLPPEGKDGPGEAGRPPSDGEGAPLRLQHCLSRHSGEGVAVGAPSYLVVRAEEQPRDLYTVIVPARIAAVDGTRFDGPILVQPYFDEARSLPADWRSCLDPFYIDLRERRSRDIGLRLPLTRAALQSRKKLRFGFKAIVAGVDYDLGTLSFEGELRTEAEPRLRLPQTVDPAVVRQTPLGIESHYPEVMALLRDGDRAFYVTGPRRCGKTSLLRAVTEDAARASEGKTLVLGPFNALERGLWHAVERSLSARLEFGCDLGLDEQGLPPEAGFEEVQERAAARGFTSICLLIDEAQALFEGSGSISGEWLKSRLEKEWAPRVDSDGPRARVIVGLFGQQHLARMMGGNCAAALQKLDRYEVTEAQLTGLLRSSRFHELESTAEARRELARRSANLYVLDLLRSKIAARCIAEKRCWYLEADVAAALESLIDVPNNSDSEWEWFRDPLNEADNRNVWRPGPQFGVALALAHLPRPVAEAQLPSAAKALLERWTDGVSVREDEVRHWYQYLKDERVVHNGDFVLPLMAPLLRMRYPDGSALLSAESAAIARMGLPWVDVPAEVLRGPASHSGGQAEVHRVGDRAFRLVNLQGDGALRRFVREVQSLSKLEQASGPVRGNLPVVRRAGFVVGRPDLGAVCYDWVEGKRLEPESLSPAGIFHVAHRLGRVLSFLESRSIVHRDIKPANIILRGVDGEPVLIDFGAALDNGATQNTIFVASPCPDSAPTSKTDVYCLGKALESCAAPGALEPCKGLLDRMVVTDPALRCSAAEVVSLCESRVHEVDLGATARMAADALSCIRPELRPILEPSVGQLAWYRHGLASGPEMAVALAAQPLEDIFARYCKKSQVRSRYLRDLRDQAGPRNTLRLVCVDSQFRSLFDAAELQAIQRFLPKLGQCVGLLRNAASHRDSFSRNVEEAYKCLGRDGRRPSDLRDAALEVTRALAQLWHEPALVPFMGLWLEAPTPPDGAAALAAG